jgi:mannosyl-oligosaccharide glucosidase
MAGYGWEEYDVRHGGRQVIHDAGNDLDLTIDFIKAPGGSHGGSWGARIKGKPRENAPTPLVTTMIFYAGLEGMGGLDISNERDPLGYKGRVTIEGQSLDLGDFKIEITEGPRTNRYPPPTHESYDEKPLDRTMVASFQVPEEALWQAKRKSCHASQCHCRKSRFLTTDRVKLCSLPT